MNDKEKKKIKCPEVIDIQEVNKSCLRSDPFNGLQAAFYRCTSKGNTHSIRFFLSRLRQTICPRRIC